MNRLTLRAFLATSVSCAALWILYELAWIPYQYDRESDRIEQRLAVHLRELSDRFESIPAERWTEEVSRINRESDDHHSLVRRGDPDWLDLTTRLQSEGTSGVLLSGADAMAAFRLPDGDALLRIDVLVFEDADQFDAAFWGFVSAGLVLGFALLNWVIGDHRRRISALSATIQRVDASGAAPGNTTDRPGDMAELESRVDGLVQHLRHTIGDLTESISAQRDLLHAVAHEFRGPIARLRFAADLADEADDPRERSTLLANIDEAVQDLEALVAEVLGYSRIRHGGYRLELEPTNVVQVAEQVVAKVRGEFPGVEFTCDGHLEEPTIQADARMLERALINIVRNGGRFARSRVEVRCSMDADTFLVTVGDDGNGVAPGKRERIFEPFTRLDASRSRDSGGSGLGLAIAQAISHQHDGEIRCAESSLGGAEFQLRWPRKPSSHHLES